MVSTRNHPASFPPPSLSPSKAHNPQPAAAWSHVPTNLTLLWLVISLPLVLWDIAYVLLRPHSMPNGKFQSPIFTPYVLYGSVDHIYGWEAYNAGNGFTAAQSILNLVETTGYLGYLWIVWKRGTGDLRAVHGGWGGLAVLIGFALSTMTLSKTVLYCTFDPHLISSPIYGGFLGPRGGSATRDEVHTMLSRLPHHGIFINFHFTFIFY